MYWHAWGKVINFIHNFNTHAVSTGDFDETVPQQAIGVHVS